MEKLFIILKKFLTFGVTVFRKVLLKERKISSRQKQPGDNSDKFTLKTKVTEEFTRKKIRKKVKEERVNE